MGMVKLEESMDRLAQGIDHLMRRLAELESLERALPRSKDGVPLVPGRTVWQKRRDGTWQSAVVIAVGRDHIRLRSPDRNQVREIPYHWSVRGPGPAHKWAERPGISTSGIGFGVYYDQTLTYCTRKGCGVSQGVAEHFGWEECFGSVSADELSREEDGS